MSSKEGEPRSECHGRKSDAARRFIGRPFFLSLTIGIPFCIFKLLFGVSAIRIGSFSHPLLTVFGWFVVVWAGADLLMNTGRAVLDLSGRPSPFEYCTIAQIGRIFSMPTVFLAVDTLFSFSIICAMLWSGWIANPHAA
ncbi:MAG: hypothetical protein PWP08_29 [Methanofollis sp.]|nr:hypothetical protein [Methanofollis sp.]